VRRQEGGAYANEVGSAEEDYMPSGPPMSPLRSSYFCCCAFYDHRMGKTTDTLADCLVDANDTMCMNPYQLDAVKKLSQSRMGMYEHGGPEGNYVRLREPVTDREFVCHSPTGYRGKNGELWYVRLFPPLEPELANYHVVFNAPYVLLDQSKDDWIVYLKRSLIGMKASADRDGLYQLLKFGLSKNHWNEFVLLAYHHHQTDAIFLTGIPDLRATLPHA
jgi:hypothetical protein